MFFSYVTLGFTIALPLGAISIEMIKQGLRNGFWYAWMIGIGAITIDITLILLLNLGLADILNEIQTYLWLLGTFFLSYLGWQSIKSDSLCIDDSDSKKDSLFKLFKKGIIIGVNPANIVFWISVLGTSISSANTNSEFSIILVSVAIILGILLHDIVLSFITSYFNRFMTPQANRWVSIIAGILLFGFAIYFFNEFLKETTLF